MIFFLERNLGGFENLQDLLTARLIFTILLFPIITNAQSFEIVPDFATQNYLDNAIGVAVADYDMDGDLDIFAVAAAVFNPNDSMTWSRLLRNDGQAGFTDVTLESQLINWEAITRDGNFGSKLGASWGDYDNDGLPDLFIANYGLDELWHNEGDGTFKNVTNSTKIEGCFFCYSTNGLWWDFDRDGDMDLYVSDWLKANRFYRNDGNGEFTDISIESGLNDRRHSFASLPIDLNEDGLQDIYVVNDNGPNNFYWNKGNGKFEEATAEVGLENLGNGMGVAVCDYQNDGDFDIYVTNIHKFAPNPFFINNENEFFTDQAKSNGIEDTGWGWGTRFFDADHDLDEDLYVVNGFFSPIAEGDENRFFKNENGQFLEMAKELGLNSDAIGMGLTVFDYDQDGDLDMLVGNRNAKIDLYQNRIIETNGNANWLQIQLQGTKSNKFGVGATVKIVCDNTPYYRHYSGANIFSQSIQPIHFGLSAHQKVEKIQVNWSSGLVEVFEEYKANQQITLVEGTGQQVNTDLVLSTTNITSFALSLYPNPFADQLFIETLSERAQTLDFFLIDMLGKIVLQQKIRIPSGDAVQTSIEITKKLESGLYFYHIFGEGIRQSGKVLKTSALK